MSEQTMWDKIPSQETINETIKHLQSNGITAILAASTEDAKEKALALIPEGAEVMTMTSITNDELGIAEYLNTSGKYNPVRDRLYAMDRKTQGLQMQKLGAAPEYAVGSVHAVTEDGKIVIASNTGSQLPAYAYGSSTIIWLVGVQKIVHNLDNAFKRIYEYVLPLESERAHKAYGVDGSFVSKLLVINKEVNPSRLHIIFVPEKIGF